jgi:hypothetical protein
MHGELNKNEQNLKSSCEFVPHCVTEARCSLRQYTGAKILIFHSSELSFISLAPFPHLSPYPPPFISLTIFIYLAISIFLTISISLRITASEIYPIGEAQQTICCVLPTCLDREIALFD